MTPEQLQKTRAERWRQNGNALVTLEDAEAWLRPLGLCLFVPRRVQLPTPAPSFVEACLGEANATPPRAAIESATALLTRLIDKGSVIPLNLLGISGEQPDFLVTDEALPFVFALRGDKDWKHEPQTAGNGRVSPLVLGIWKALERTGVQTAVELRESMGKELTEAAVLRGLSELWNAMRVIMLPADGGEGATWELLKARFQKPMAAGAGMSQVSALSVLLAQYLESVVGATSEEAEIFLSPLSSRSKVREVVRGLTATRQLAMIGLDGQAILYVEGTLPEFEVPASQVTIEAAGPELGPELEASSSVLPAMQKTTRIQKIRKFIKRPALAPGEADPLRWKRDSSVSPPAGERRDESRRPRPDSRASDSRGRDSQGPDAPRPDAQGFDRRSAPKSPGRPASFRPAAGGRAGRPRSDSKGPENSRFDRPRTAAGTAKFERPSRPFSKPARGEGGGFAARPGGTTGRADRPSFARPASGRSFAKSASRNSDNTPRDPAQGARNRGPGSFEKKPRWVPREGRNAQARGTRENVTGRPRGEFPGADRADRSARGFSGSRPPARAGGFRSGDKPPAGGFKARSGAPRSGPKFSDRQSPTRPSSDRPFSGRSSGGSGSYSPQNRPSSRGDSRSFKKAGAGGFKPRADRAPDGPSSGRTGSDRSFTGRPTGSRPAASGGFQTKPRWVPREGGKESRPLRAGSGRSFGTRSREEKPGDSSAVKPDFARRPGFGARSSASGRPSFGSGRPPFRGGRPASGDSRPSSSARPDRPEGRPTGRAGFGRKPGGKPAFGTKRPDSNSSGPRSKGPGSSGPRSSAPRSKGPGDYPKRKRPE